MKKTLLIMIGLFLWASLGYCQDTAQLLGQVAQVYTGSDGSSGEGLIAGFSMWGLLGGFIFSGIGFIAFIYGKKNSEFRSMITGIALMVYPYFFKETIYLYLIGAVLTAVLYFWHE